MTDPPGPRCLPGLTAAKTADMKVAFSCPLSPGQADWALLAPLSSPDCWAQEAAEIAEMLGALCLQPWETLAHDLWRGWARDGEGAHQGLHLFCVLKPKSVFL